MPIKLNPESAGAMYDYLLSQGYIFTGKPDFKPLLFKHPLRGLAGTHPVRCQHPCLYAATLDNQPKGK